MIRYQVLHLEPTDYDFAAAPALSRLTSLAPVASPAAPRLPLGYDLKNFHGVPACMAGLNPNAENLADGIHEEKPLDPAEIFKNCPHFSEAATTHGAGYPQGLWMQDVLAATWFEDGLRWAHNLSKGYTGYSEDETDKMYERKVGDRRNRNLGWPSCTAFANAGCKSCATCVYRGKIKSPLHLASRVEPAAEALETGRDRPNNKLSVAAIRAIHKTGARREVLFAALNETYAVVQFGSQVLIASIVGRDVLLMEPEDFHKMFANVRYPEGKALVSAARRPDAAFVASRS